MWHILTHTTNKNSIIEIKANTIVASILPISISQFENTTLNNYLLKELKDDSKIFYPHNTQEYSLALKKYGEDNHRTANWYAKGIDHNNNIQNLLAGRKNRNTQNIHVLHQDLRAIIIPWFWDYSLLFLSKH